MPKGKVIMHIADGELRQGPPRRRQVGRSEVWDYQPLRFPEDMIRAAEEIHRITASRPRYDHFAWPLGPSPGTVLP